MNSRRCLNSRFLQRAVIDLRRFSECFYLAERTLKFQASLNSAFRSMGATTIAAVIEPNEILFLYAGDCRLYHFHPEEPPFVTWDQTRGAALVGSGRL